MIHVKGSSEECILAAECGADDGDGNSLTSLAMQSSEVDSQHLERIVVTSSASDKTSSRSAVGAFWANFMRWLNSQKRTCQLTSNLSFSSFIMKTNTGEIIPSFELFLFSSCTNTSAMQRVLRAGATAQHAAFHTEGFKFSVLLCSLSFGQIYIVEGWI